MRKQSKLIWQGKIDHKLYVRFLHPYSKNGSTRWLWQTICCLLTCTFLLHLHVKILKNKESSLKCVWTLWQNSWQTSQLRCKSDWNHLGSLVLFCLVLYLLSFLLGTRRRKNFPPGPMALPLFGNLLEFNAQNPIPDMNRVRLMTNDSLIFRQAGVFTGRGAYVSHNRI